MSEENISANGNLPGKINLNTAAEDELGQVPGLGPTMAKRIVAARPFIGLEDLQRVSGIGPNLMERIKPYITLDNVEAEADGESERTFETAMLVDDLVESAEYDEAPEEAALVEMAEAEEDLASSDALEEEAAEEIADEVIDGVEEDLAVEEPPSGTEEEWVAKVLSSEPEDVPEPILPKSPPATVPSVATVAPSGVSRGQVLWMVVGSSLLAFLLAIALSLGVLAALNDGQLQFASPGQVIDLRQQINTLGEQAQTLDGDIGSLRTRMDNLEPLGDRVGVVEQTAADLASDLATTGDQVAELGLQAEVVAGEVDALQTENERFGTFFTGLQGLLEQVFASGETP